MLDTEFLLGERTSELRKVKDETIEVKAKLEERVSELEDKVSFYRQN